jgi:mycothiol synthase
VGIKLRRVESDADYAAWRQVHMAVLPGERCDTLAELRRDASPSRLLLLATRGVVVVGSGLAEPSQTAGGFIEPQVLPAFRRQGIGGVLLRALADHVSQLGLPTLKAHADDPGALAFAGQFGFAEIDRQIEQIRAVGREPLPPGSAADLEVISLSSRPGLWEACFDGFGQQVLADFALEHPIQVSRAQWVASWAGDPMFVALYDGQVIGCAGLHRDPDQPARAEHALTAVRKDWRNRGVASYLKRQTLHWAAANGLTEVYTWTQRGNHHMRRLNEHLGYAYGKQSITVSRRLPLLSGGPGTGISSAPAGGVRWRLTFPHGGEAGAGRAR